MSTINLKAETVIWALACAGLAAGPLCVKGVEKESAKEKAAQHKVQMGKLKTDVELDVVLEAKHMQPLQLNPKVWTDLSVVECVDHGAKVKRGDVLLRLDTEKITDQLADLRRAAPGEKAALELAEAELANGEKTAPMKLEAARRAKIRASEEYDYFVEVAREDREQSARWRVRNAEQNLRNETEELTQLQKMYEADDLTEDTEEIILTRQKYSVETAQYYLENAKQNLERELRTMIPRAHEDLKNSKLETELALSLAEQTHQTQLEQKRLNVEKMRRDRAKNEKKVAEMQEDLEGLSVEAPMDGLVYYGACEGGKWISAAALSKKLVPGGKIGPREVFMTVVDPSELQLLSVVPEEKLSKVRMGMKGKAAPVSASDLELPVRVEDISWVPLATGGFSSTLSVELPKAPRLMPGMNCKVKLSGGEAKETLLAPKDAVFGEGDARHVYLQQEGEKPIERTVKVGESDNKMIQILEGLEEGDEILLKKPE